MKNKVKNKIIYLVSMLIAFCLGGLVTYIAMTKQQMDAVLQGQSTQSNQQVTNANNSFQNNSNNLNNTTTDSTANTAQQNQQIAKELANKANKDNANNENNKSLNINDYSETQAKQIVKDMPDVVLNQYVDKFMAKDASNVIADKRRFAERAIEELYRPNDNQPLVGSIKISLNQQFPDNTAEEVTKVSKFEKIYAHLDTNGQVPSSPYTFVKWINNQTGQVLLFEKKDIVADSNQNWVSFIPDDGWQVGSYDVRFYQFTSELEPIAQTTYNIYEVVE